MKPVTVSLLIRRTLLAVIALLLLWLTWTGLSQGLKQLPQSQTLGQLAQTITQFAFGLFALLSLVTTFWGARWNTLMLAGWTLSVTLAAGLASVVWGGTSLVVGLLAGGGALLVGLGIAWLLRLGARGLTRA